MPATSIIPIIDRQYRCDQYFEDFYQKGSPIVNQIEAWANKYNISLNEGWKVEIARAIQNRFDKIMESLPTGLKDNWIRLFETITKE